MTDISISRSSRVIAFPMPAAPVVRPARRRRHIQLRRSFMARCALALVAGAAAGAIIPSVALILTGHAFLAAIGI